MNYKDFQHLARLYVVGSLDEDEMEEFQTGRELFGARAEEFITECRDLNAVFALSLLPCPPKPETKAKLLAQIRAMPRCATRPVSEEPPHDDALLTPELAVVTRSQRLN